MARAVSLRQQWPRGILHHHQRCCCPSATHPSSVLHVFSSFHTHKTRFSIHLSGTGPHPLFISTIRTLGSQSRSLSLPEPSDLREDSVGDSESLTKKSRNERKREARRAVRWGMELATFSSPQIKRILRVASLERDVYDALMLVKRFGPDVREGKRRQFNYIGRLLRNAQPELMDAIIQASKDGDNIKLQVLSGEETWTNEHEDEEESETEYDDDDDDVPHNYAGIATRWFDGLIDKDSSITKEVYSLYNVEFDRQELRKLVRRVQFLQEGQLEDANGDRVDAALTSAKKSLIRFLHALAKQASTIE